MEEIVPNLSPPMCVNVSERRGRLCVLKSVDKGHIGTLAHSSFQWRWARIFNALPPKIRNLSNCDVLLFKRQLDNYLSLLPDVPCTPNTDNSITGQARQTRPNSGGVAEGQPRFDKGGGVAIIFHFLCVRNIAF